MNETEATICAELGRLLGIDRSDGSISSKRDAIEEMVAAMGLLADRARAEGRAAGLAEAARIATLQGQGMMASKLRGMAVSAPHEKVEGGTLPAWGGERDRKP